MPLINCKIHLKLNWTKDYVMSSVTGVTFKITNTKLYVQIVTLSSKDNVKILEEEFKRPVYWNDYQVKMETNDLDNNNLTRFPLDASFRGVRRLFALAFDSTNGGDKKVERNSHTKYFLPKVNIKNYNVLIDGRTFYDQSINDMIKQFDRIRKTVTGEGDDYTTDDYTTI